MCTFEEPIFAFEDDEDVEKVVRPNDEFYSFEENVCSETNSVPVTCQERVETTPIAKFVIGDNIVVNVYKYDSFESRVLAGLSPDNVKWCDLYEFDNDIWFKYGNEEIHHEFGFFWDDERKDYVSHMIYGNHPDRWFALDENNNIVEIK